MEPVLAIGCSYMGAYTDYAATTAVFNACPFRN